MTYTDHAAEARRLLRESDEAAQALDDMPTDIAEQLAEAVDHGLRTAAAQAQAHATLAVAEQLRIANLLSIAHGDPEGSTSRSARDMAYIRLHNGDLPELLADDVAVALGISGGS